LLKFCTPWHTEDQARGSPASMMKIHEAALEPRDQNHTQRDESTPERTEQGSAPKKIK